MTKAQARAGVYPASAGANSGYTAVPPSEGNEVTRDGRLGVGALHSTVEVGELAPGDPMEGRECRSHDT